MSWRIVASSQHGEVVSRAATTTTTTTTPNTVTTFKYFVKRFPNEDEDLSEILASPTLHQQHCDEEREGIDGSSDAQYSRDDDDEKTIMTENRPRKHRELQQPHLQLFNDGGWFPEEEIVFAPRFDIGTKTSWTTSAHGQKRTSPPSPKSVIDELESFSFEPFDEFFADEKNPFRSGSAQSTRSTVTSDLRRSPPTERSLPEGDSSTSVSKMMVAVDISPQLPDSCVRMQAPHPPQDAAAKAENETYSGELQEFISPDLDDMAIAAPGQSSKVVDAEKRCVVPESTMLMEEVITPKLRLNIDDYDSEFFKKLMHDLMCQSRIQKLDIYRNWEMGTSSARTRTVEEMALLFQMVQSLPNLHSLHLTNMDASTDLYHFHDAVFGHRALQTVRIHMAIGGIDETTLRTLNMLPLLKEVSFETTESFDASMLLQSATLQKLHIGSSSSYTFDNTHLMALVPMLECNSTLIELDLEPQMTFLAFKFMAYALRVNRSIQFLQIAVEPTTHADLLDQALCEIATLLKVNSTLRAVHNVNHHSMHATVSNYRKILSALKANSSLEFFHLFHEEPAFSKQKKQLLKPVDMSSNDSLANIKSFSDGSQLKSSIASYATDELSTDGSVLDFQQELADQQHSLFCSALDSIDMSPVIRSTRHFLQSARDQGEMVSSAICSFFARKTTTRTDPNGQKQKKRRSKRSHIRNDSHVSIDTTRGTAQDTPTVVHHWNGLEFPMEQDLS